jgi:rfaE bifunctional protein kinase chain/domain
MPLSITRDRLQALLNGGRSKRVLVVGDAMLDEYLIGDVERISPEAPVPVVRVRERRHALGGAGNVAQNVSAAGASCSLVATIGSDAAGEQLASMLKNAGIATDGLVRVPRPTTRKTRVLARSQQLVRVDEEDDRDLAAADVERVVALVRSAVANADAVVLEDYNKGLLTPPVITEAITAARARKLPVIVDPKYKHFFAYRGATVFKPNRRELEAALGSSVDLEHPESLPATLDRLEVEHLLLTLGERGMMLIQRGGKVDTVPTVARQVYDVVGAGDTVTAYLATVLAASGTAREAAVIANYAAGVEVGKLGAATVTPEEILEAYDELATSGAPRSS